MSDDLKSLLRLKGWLITINTVLLLIVLAIVFAWAIPAPGHPPASPKKDQSRRTSFALSLRSVPDGNYPMPVYHRPAVLHR